MKTSRITFPPTRRIESRSQEEGKAGKKEGKQEQRETGLTAGVASHHNCWIEQTTTRQKRGKTRTERDRYNSWRDIPEQLPDRADNIPTKKRENKNRERPA